MPAMVLVIGLVVLELINPASLNTENLLFSTSDFAQLITATAGLTLVIMTGGIDISGVPIMGLASIVPGLMFVAGVPIGFAVIAALTVGLGAGAFDGTVIAETDINPLIVTLAMLFLYSGIVTGLQRLRDMPGFKASGAGGFDAYQYEGDGGLPKSFTWIGAGGIGWVSKPLITTVLIVLVASWLMTRTRSGRILKIIGLSDEVARFTGVPVLRTRIAVYALNGFAAAVAGLVLTACFNSARSDLGAEAGLDIITAVVLGGSSIYGGQGSVLRTCLAGLVLGSPRHGLPALDITSGVVPVIVGHLLIGSVALKIGTGVRHTKRANRAACESERVAVAQNGG